MNNIYNFKLIIAGDGGVGKTTLLNRYINGTFLEDFRLTVGIKVVTKHLTRDGDTINLQIWDLGGQERFRIVLPPFFQGAHGVLFIYDTTSSMSLYHIEDWINVLQSRGGNIPIVAGGTKIDLPDVRSVTKEEAVNVLGKFGITEVIEVSSKTGTNVDALFDAICTMMINYINTTQITQAIPPVTQEPKTSIPES